jgi:hypothetical protein
MADVSGYWLPEPSPAPATSPALAACPLAAAPDELAEHHRVLSSRSYKAPLDTKQHVVYCQLMTTPAWTTLEQAIERSKSEILGDVVGGTVPASCASYSELHDYVDANGYGGSFEHDFDNEETDFWNAVQDAVDAWIRAGGLKS